MIRSNLEEDLLDDYSVGGGGSAASFASSASSQIQSHFQISHSNKDKLKLPSHPIFRIPCQTGHHNPRPATDTCIQKSTNINTMRRSSSLFYPLLPLCLWVASTVALQYQQRISARQHVGRSVPQMKRLEVPSCCQSPRYRSSLSATTERTNGINGKSALSHRDIVWKIRSHPDQPFTARVYFQAAAWLLRTYLQLTKRILPTVLCPAGGLCQIEAWYHGQKVGRFGITTSPGPSMPIIAKQVAKLYPSSKNQPILPKTAAIQYMVVEPDFRKRQIGSLALQVIAHVHAYLNCDFTLLVADDNGGGKLVDWYQRHGYERAPLLQDLLGSPNQKYGVTMLGPTNSTLPEDCRLEWW